MLDEPFGALDQFTREELWAIMQELWIELRPTVLLVTHDLKEAGYLANRICVMRARPGHIIDDARGAVPAPAHHRDAYTPAFVTHDPAFARRILAAARAKEARDECRNTATDRVDRCSSSASSCSGRRCAGCFMSPISCCRSRARSSSRCWSVCRHLAACRADAVHDPGRLCLWHRHRHALGILIGSSRLAYDVAYPLLVGFSTIPKVAVVPIFVLWFGAGTVPACSPP